MSKERIQIQQSIEQSQEFTKMPKAFVSILNGANPSVADVSILKCSGDTVTVTDFKDGQEGQRIHIRGDGLTTIQDNANIITNTGLDKLLASGQIYSFTAFYDEVLKIITWVEDECCGGTGEGEVDLSDYYTKAEVDGLIVPAPVSSVFGRLGAVVAAAGDYDAFYYTKAVIDAALLGYSLVGHTHSFASLVGIPTTIAGYGITDFNSLGDARWSLLGHVHSFASLTSKPTTLAGYGITDTFFTQADADLLYAALGHTHSFASLTSKPTTIAGYGITDAYTKTEVDTLISGIPAAPVSSVFGRTGAVVAAANDYTFAQLASKPTTIAGYGITDFNSLGDARYVQLSGFNALGDARYSLLAHTHTFASLTSLPTTIAGFGITDFNSLGDARWSLLAHVHTFASLTSKPTTIAGYGITDFNSLGDARWSLLAHVHAFSTLTGIPTTIAGYGITDFNSLGDARWSLLAHTHTFASLTSKPTTIAGYGITDLNSLGDARWLLLTGGTLAGDLLFSPDGTYNIGASGATRPNYVHVKTQLKVGQSVFQEAGMELGSQTGAGAALIDFHTDGAATDYNARLLRASGANGIFYITQTGTGGLNFQTTDTDRWSISGAGHFLAAVDNTYDIGASGATRPRNVYAGTGLLAGNTRYLDTAVAPTADNSYIRLLGGSNDDVNNGAYCLYTGNGFTAANRGMIQFLAGNPTTPTGSDGQILFYTGAAGLRWAINRAGHLLAGSDNAYDIGATGATRPRDLFLAGKATIGGAFGCNGATARTAATAAAAVATGAGANGYATTTIAANIITLLNQIRAALVANGIMV